MPKIRTVCDNCGKEIEQRPSRIKKAKRHFCSRRCQGKWKSKSEQGENNPNWKGGKLKRVCPVCGKEFEVKPSEIKRGSGKFCSLSCARRAQKNFKTTNKARINI